MGGGGRPLGESGGAECSGSSHDNNTCVREREREMLAIFSVVGRRCDFLVGQSREAKHTCGRLVIVALRNLKRET